MNGSEQTKEAPPGKGLCQSVNMSKEGKKQGSGAARTEFSTPCEVRMASDKGSQRNCQQ